MSNQKANPWTVPEVCAVKRNGISILYKSSSFAVKKLTVCFTLLAIKILMSNVSTTGCRKYSLTCKQRSRPHVRTGRVNKYRSDMGGAPNSIGHMLRLGRLNSGQIGYPDESSGPRMWCLLDHLTVPLCQSILKLWTTFLIPLFGQRSDSDSFQQSVSRLVNNANSQHRHVADSGRFHEMIAGTRNWLSWIAPCKAVRQRTERCEDRRMSGTSFL